MLRSRFKFFCLFVTIDFILSFQRSVKVRLFDSTYVKNELELEEEKIIIYVDGVQYNAQILPCDVHIARHVNVQHSEVFFFLGAWGGD